MKWPGKQRECSCLNQIPQAWMEDTTDLIGYFLTGWGRGSFGGWGGGSHSRWKTLWMVSLFSLKYQLQPLVLSWGLSSAAQVYPNTCNLAPFSHQRPTSTRCHFSVNMAVRRHSRSHSSPLIPEANRAILDSFFGVETKYVLNVSGYQRWSIFGRCRESTSGYFKWHLFEKWL